MDRTRSFGEDHNQLPARAASANVARYLARERQKQELRRERDVLLLDLARDLGTEGLAERLGVTGPAVGRLLTDALDRLDADAPSPRRPRIGGGRSGVGRDRWVDADVHYETLGRRTDSPSTAQLPR
ncbi:MAG TPA: hypothetical protein VN772_01455 [Solirubrobacteraceae bacterium]|nr:hypothetical protein [Solirubrobacteraceae bacterium]